MTNIPCKGKKILRIRIRMIMHEGKNWERGVEGGGWRWRRQGKLRDVVGGIQRFYDQDMTRYIICYRYHYHYWISFSPSLESNHQKDGGEGNMVNSKAMMSLNEAQATSIMNQCMMMMGDGRGEWGR